MCCFSTHSVRVNRLFTSAARRTYTRYRRHKTVVARSVNGMEQGPRYLCRGISRVRVHRRLLGGLYTFILYSDTSEHNIGVFMMLRDEYT